MFGVSVWNVLVLVFVFVVVMAFLICSDLSC